jgi:creatinine amidohydrolase
VSGALALAAWPELARPDPGNRPLLLVPVGSLEQHGPALPLATDTTLAEAVTRRVVRRLGAGVLAAPAIAYGASGEHEDFPGTVSVGHEALRLVLVELARSACRWTGGVVFVNGHGGNTATVVAAVRQLRAEGRAAAWTSCAIPGGDAHAGATETALMLHLAPKPSAWTGSKPASPRP